MKVILKWWEGSNKILYLIIEIGHMYRYSVRTELLNQVI